MKKMMIAAMLACPFAFAGAQDSSPANEPQEEYVETAQRPNSQKIMLELSSLRLSSKQEARLTEVIEKKAKEFDKLMKEYDKTSAEEKNLRYKVSAQRQGLLQINRSIPDLIKDSLDEEQRQGYSAILDAKNKSAPKDEPGAAGAASVADESAAPKPVKKHRVLKKKRRLPVPAEAAVEAAPPSSSEQEEPAKEGAGAIPAAPDQAAAAPAEEEPGSVMVDKEQGPIEPPVHKKKRVLKKKAAVPAKAAAPAEDIMANEPAQPAGQLPPAAEEDAGSYP